MIIRCKMCGKKYKIRPSYITGNNCCSRRCMGKLQGKMRAEAAGGVGAWVKCVCVICGEKFLSRRCQVKRGGGKACSLNCASKLNSRRGTGHIKKICSTCGKTFVYENNHGKGIYCSHKCRGKSDIQPLAGRRKVKYLKHRCAICGKMFERPPHRNGYDAKTCSRNCNSQYAARHNKFFHNRVEQRMEAILVENGIGFESQKRIPGIAFPDFFVNPNICIFVDGDYWHTRGKNPKLDLERNEQMRENGFLVLRFWESDIMKLPELVQSFLDELVNIKNIRG